MGEWIFHKESREQVSAPEDCYDYGKGYNQGIETCWGLRVAVSGWNIPVMLP
jgi:hypothetical protein